MKLPQMNPPEAGKPVRFYLLFEFISICPVEKGSPLRSDPGRQDFRFPSIPNDRVL
jgi:hypothetical protein